MRAVRFFAIAVLIVAGLAGKSMAQPTGVYFNTPGVYNDVRVGVVPAMVPPSFGSLPKLGPDVFIGTLTISKGSSGYTATYDGVRLKGNLFDELDKNSAHLGVTATFTNDWIGVKLGTLIVASSLEDNVIIGIDSPHLVSAQINGVGSVDDALHRVIAKVSAGPSLDMFKVLKAPGNLR
jgi:hypothetical protein